MPQLKTKEVITWTEKGVGENFRALCTVLEGNLTPTKELDLRSEEKEERKEI